MRDWEITAVTNEGSPVMILRNDYHGLRATISVSLTSKGETVLVAFTDTGVVARRPEDRHLVAYSATYRLAAMVIDAMIDLSAACEEIILSGRPEIDHTTVTVAGPDAVAAIAPFFDSVTEAILDTFLELGVGTGLHKRELEI